MSVCWPTAQLKAAQELYAARHEDKPFHDGSFGKIGGWAEKRSRAYPFRYDDGVSFWMSPVDLPDPFDWLGSGPSSAEQEDGEDDQSDDDA